MQDSVGDNNRTPVIFHVPDIYDLYQIASFGFLFASKVLRRSLPDRLPALPRKDLSIQYLACCDNNRTPAIY